MSEKNAREKRRNLQHQIGETAASAVAEAKATAGQLALQHRVLAQQMHDFERTVAAVKESRAADRKLLADQAERLENLQARLVGAEDLARQLVGEERTHRLKLADEQRRYVDTQDVERERQLRQRIAQLERPVWRRVWDWLTAEEQIAVGDGI